MPAEALGEALIELRGIGDCVESLFAEGAGRFDRTQQYAADGALSCVAWLREKCRLSAGAASDRLAIARQLPELPATNEAFQRGDIGFQHAALIARIANQVGAEAVRPSEPVLLERAAEFDPDRFSVLTRHVRHIVDPDGTLTDANRAYNRRYFHLNQSFEGTYHLEGFLDAEGGATLKAALMALDPALPGDERPAWQRRADALVELARRQLDGGRLPEIAGSKPHLTVTASIDALRRIAGSPAAELDGNTPIPAATLRRIACDASASLVAVDDRDQPVGAGRATRTVPPSLRRALNFRDRGCRFPSWDRPVEWTDGHHVEHWADGGETTLSNLALLCRRHHRKVHEEGWRLMRRGERWLAVPPDGLRPRQIGHSAAAARAPA